VASDRRRPKTWDDLYHKRFLNAESFQGKKVTLTITDLYVDELPDDSGKMEDHGLLNFKETKREMKINYTNGTCMRLMFGIDDPTKLIGHRVTFYPTSVPFGKEMKLGIRVWGSPELEHDMVVEVPMPRRKRPERHTMHAVRKGQQQAQETETKHEPEPEPEQHGDAWEGPDDG